MFSNYLDTMTEFSRSALWKQIIKKFPVPISAIANIEEGKPEMYTLFEQLENQLCALQHATEKKDRVASIQALVHIMQTFYEIKFEYRYMCFMFGLESWDQKKMHMCVREIYGKKLAKASGSSKYRALVLLSIANEHKDEEKWKEMANFFLNFEGITDFGYSLFVPRYQWPLKYTRKR